MASSDVLNTAPTAAPVFIVKSFAAVVWLVAKGYEPLSAVYNPLGDNVDYLFHRDARAAWAAYYPAKDKLVLLAQQAKEQVA